MSGAVRRRVPADWFERLYSSDPDPWRFASSEYERRKYAATLAALPREHYRSALEVGCAIGVFTAALADRCDSVCGIDVSARALELAHARLDPRANVILRQAVFPEGATAGAWDLIVCSEVLYYLDAPAFGAAMELLGSALAGGADVLAVHWRPETRTYPFRGDEVHDRLNERFRACHRLDARTDRYRLDVFTGT